VKRIEGDILKVFQQPELRAKWDAAGFVVDLMPADGLAAMLKRQLTTVAEIAKQANIQPE
jgi:tripartite-type tricarboxylate transporter receptor subunit TctC